MDFFQTIVSIICIAIAMAVLAGNIFLCAFLICSAINAIRNKIRKKSAYDISDPGYERKYQANKVMRSSKNTTGVLLFISVIVLIVIGLTQNDSNVTTNFIVGAIACLIAAFLFLRKTKKEIAERKELEEHLTDPNLHQSVMSKEEAKAIRKRYTLMQAQRDSEIMAESFHLASTTLNFEVFCERYDLAMEKANTLLRAEQAGVRLPKAIRIANHKASNAILNGGEALKIRMIEDYMQNGIDQAETLKTERGKLNRYLKMEKELADVKSRFEGIEVYYAAAADIELKIASLESKNFTTGSDFVKVTTEHFSDFPKYPNEDTDIPAESYLYDVSGRIVGRADGLPLNDADAAYLMRRGYERVKNGINDSNSSEHRGTDEDIELEYQFMYYHGEESDEVCNTFLKLSSQANRTNKIDDKINLLYQCVDAFENAKNWHYNYSRGAMLLFQHTWERTNVSYDGQLSTWISKKLDSIKKLEYMRGFVIPWIIENAEQGFKQTEIYKAFPDDNKSMLREAIDYAILDGKVEKVKNGNTYFVKAIA